jgi:uncharacterized DUF497 family protein
MRKARFEWDEAKDVENQAKHGASFAMAQKAFLDPSASSQRIRVTARQRNGSFASAGWVMAS